MLFLQFLFPESDWFPRPNQGQVSGTLTSIDTSCAILLGAKQLEFSEFHRSNFGRISGGKRTYSPTPASHLAHLATKPHFAKGPFSWLRRQTLLMTFRSLPFLPAAITGVVPASSDLTFAWVDSGLIPVIPGGKMWQEWKSYEYRVV